MTENAHFQRNMQGFLETRHVLWWKGHSALTLAERTPIGWIFETQTASE